MRLNLNLVLIQTFISVVVLGTATFAIDLYVAKVFAAASILYLTWNTLWMYCLTGAGYYNTSNEYGANENEVYTLLAKGVVVAIFVASLFLFFISMAIPLEPIVIQVNSTNNNILHIQVNKAILTFFAQVVVILAPVLLFPLWAISRHEGFPKSSDYLFNFGRVVNFINRVTVFIIGVVSIYIGQYLLTLIFH